MTDPVYGGTAEWLHVVMARAQRRIGPMLRKIIHNDFFFTTLGTELTSGFGTIDYDLALSGGMANLQTGTSILPPNNYALVYNAGASRVIANASNRSCYVEARSKATVAATPTMVWDYVGLWNTDWATLGVDGSVDLTKIIMRLSSGGQRNIISDVDYELDVFHSYALGLNFETGTLSAWMDDSDNPIIETTDLSNLTTQSVVNYSFVKGEPLDPNGQLIVDYIATAMEEEP